MNTSEFVKNVNALRLANKNKWYTLQGTVNNVDFQIKGYGTWLQVFNICGINGSNVMEQSVKEYKQHLTDIANDYGIEVGVRDSKAPDIPIDSWNYLIGHYLLEDLELTTNNGSSFYVDGDELDNAYMDISLNGNLYFYIAANGMEESISAQITSVSNNTIYMYDSYFKETDEMDYLFDGEKLTLSDSEYGDTVTMDWLLQ